MLLSMTGFGAARREANGVIARVEVKSVNHRHLQTKVRAPAELAALEPEIEARVRARLARGAVQVTVALEHASDQRAVDLDRDAAKRWRDALRSLAAELGVPDDAGIAALLQLPGVVAAPTASQDDAAAAEREGATVLGALDDALGAMIGMRAEEGAALERDLAASAGAIEGLVARVGERMPEVVRAHHEALRERIGELVGESVAEADLAREAALLADRMDVGEELARLASHLAQWRALVATGGSIGRKLDFMAQELFREANTTGAKCNDAEVAHLVVEMKTYIERLREQVQNVE